MMSSLPILILGLTTLIKAYIMLLLDASAMTNRGKRSYEYMEIKLVGAKFQELCQWEHIEYVNEELDKGRSPNAVWTESVKKGLKVSRPVMYEYAKLRKQALVENINVEHIIDSVINAKPNVDKKKPETRSRITKLRSEIDALDLIISGGYNTLIAWGDRPIAPKTMMEAIKLKAELTGGGHEFLTTYGMEKLKEMERDKFQLLLQHLISYIPANRRLEAINKLEDIEDQFYRGTDYYEDYLRSKGYPEERIQRVLYQMDKNDNGTPDVKPAILRVPIKKDKEEDNG